MPFIYNIIFVLVTIFLFDTELVLILIFILESHHNYFSLSLPLFRMSYLVYGFPLPVAFGSP